MLSVGVGFSPDLSAAAEVAATSAFYLTSVSPNIAGTAARAFSIMGTGFDPAATVTINGQACGSVVWLNRSTLTATSPAAGLAIGANDVIVTNPGPTPSNTLVGAWTKMGVSSVSPSSGDDVDSTNVTLTGAGFINGATVTVGGIAATNVTWVNSTTITCTFPPGTAGDAAVLVTQDGYTGGGTGLFAYRITSYTLNAEVWYRSDRSVTTSSGRVTTWTNTSPNNSNAARNMTDASISARRPLYTASDSDFANLPSVTFDDAGRLLRTGTFSSTIATPQTLMIVGKPSGTAADGQVYFGGTSAHPWIYKNGADANLYAHDSAAGVLGAHSAPFVAIVTFNGASSAHMHSTTTETAFGAGAGHTIADMQLGANLAGVSGCKIVEAAMFSGAMALADRQALITALGTRYGITIS